VHPTAPITVVEAPLAVAQILETPLLNHRNFGTLIATKASRVVESAHGGMVLEFGMRRAHGFGANAATRASLIGGADFSSNTGASLDLEVEPKGTHAHAMIQVFMAVAGGELEAFRAYAEVYPDDCLLLVDTIDTLESGVPNAITVFEELKKRGHEPVGIRLDSGDLAHLAVRSAAMLANAGFPDSRIVLSSQLDELNIWQIRNQILDEAARYDVDADHLLRRITYGVGSRMVTSDGDPTLDGVYKVVSVEDENGTFVPALKLSDNPVKSTLPGRKALWRIYDERGRATADLIALDHETIDGVGLDLLHPSDPGVHRRLEVDEISRVELLLQKHLDRGRPVRANGNIEEARRRRAADLDVLDTGVRRLVNPHTYHVSITPAVHDLREELAEGYRP
jgi:nicotinate phosphoribosyltransferase